MDKIDYLTVIYKNYDLLYLQREQFDKLGISNYRLIIVDNTPNSEYTHIEPRNNELIIRRENNGGEFDGVSHGLALDLGIQHCNSDIICVFDSDYFFLTDPTEYIKNKFDEGYLAIGAEFWNRSYLKNYDNFSHILKNIPCCFCGYYKKELIQNLSWVVTQNEVNWNTSYIEVGWRIRQHINVNDIKTFGWQCKSDNNLNNFVYFDENGNTVGLHIVAGSHRSIGLTNNIKNYIAQTNLTNATGKEIF